MRKAAYFFSSCIFIFFLILGSGRLFAQKLSAEEESICQLLATGKIDQARETLEKDLIPAFPNNLNFRLYLGIAHYLRGDMEKALKELKKADAELKDKRVSSRAPQGTSLFNLQSSMDMDLKAPTFAEQNKGLLYYSYGLTLKNGANFKGAEKMFLESRKCKYDQASLAFQLFEVYTATNSLKSASQEVDGLRQALGDQPIIALVEGCLLYYKGQVDDSLAALEKIKDSFKEAKLNMGLIHFNQGDTQKALDIWTEMLVSAPSDQEVLMHMGQAYFRLGDKARAQEYFDKAGGAVPPEQYYPKTIPLSLGKFTREAEFQLACR